MSTPIHPFAVWASGTNQNSIPANDNSLRLQILNGMVISIENDPPTSYDGDIYQVGGSPTGDFSTFNEFDLAIFSGGNWYAFAPSEGIVINLAGTAKYWDGDSYEDWGTGGGGAVSSVNGDTGSVIVQVPIGIACSDETTALTTGVAKATFRVPFAMTLTAVRASVTTAPTGANLVVDINEGGVSILSTKLSIDATEKTSTTATTPPVISDSSLADDAEMTIDIDQIGSTIAGAGLKVWLIGYPT